MTTKVTCFRAPLRLLSLLPLLPLAFACTTGGSKSKSEPVAKPSGDAPQQKPGAKPAQPAPVAKPETAATPPAAPAGDPAAATDGCVALDKLPAEPPFYVTGRSVVLTRIFKPCVTKEGLRGAERTTPWLAMGFPCTAGEGRVDIKGNVNAPKMVSFVLGTDCPMDPSNKDTVRQIMQEGVGLPLETKLMAYTPFVVQYWEIPGMEDADVGFSVDLRSTPAIELLWPKFKNKEPIRIRLFGRENVWGQGDNVYFVEADIVSAARGAFKLDVVQARSLSKDELAQVKTHCEGLRPRRNCGEVF